MIDIEQPLPLTLPDVSECAGIQITPHGDGYRVWVCVDGQCVLRLTTLEVELSDDREH